MPVTGNIFFSFIVCEHNAQHMIIGHIKIIPLPHLCQRFHFSRAPKAVSSPVKKTFAQFASSGSNKPRAIGSVDAHCHSKAAEAATSIGLRSVLR